MILLIWSVVFLASFSLYLYQTYTRFTRHGVKNWTPVPLLGSMTRVVLALEHFVENLDRVYNSFPGERFVGTYEFVKPVVFIRDLELVKKITVKDFEYFLDHRVFVDEKTDPFFGRNLFSLKGQEWKDMRSTLSPAFTSSKMKVMVPFMIEAGDQMIHSLKKQIRESGKNYIDVEIKDLSTHYANDVIASCAFGLKMDSHSTKDSKFYEMGKTASQLNFIQMLKFFLFTAFPGIMKFFKVSIFTENTKDFFRDLVHQTMKERDAHNIVRPDMIHLLMETKKGNLLVEDGIQGSDATDTGFAAVQESTVGKITVNRAWSDDDLIAQAVLFFIAGFETVAIAMTFLVYELAINSDVQERLVQEIKDNDLKNGGKFDYNSIQQMTYLDMVVSEMLRLWTPGAVLDRICTKDYNLGRPNDQAKEDFIIRKGEGVKIPTWAFHRDPQYFPNPLKFDPERFSEENKHNIKPFTYNPFGIGPRNCIASRFALCEVKVMVYQLLQHMEIFPCEKTAVPVKLATTSFNLIIKGGHWVRMKVRE